MGVFLVWHKTAFDCEVPVLEFWVCVEYPFIAIIPSFTLTLSDRTS